MRINFYAVYKNFLLFKDTQIINLFIISLFIVKFIKWRVRRCLVIPPYIIIFLRE